MSKNSKRNRSQKQPSYHSHRSYQSYLIQSLGTPDGVHALGEFIRNTTTALILALATLFILFMQATPCRNIVPRRLRLGCEQGSFQALSITTQNEPNNVGTKGE
jgi:hypothetical protein